MKQFGISGEAMDHVDRLKAEAKGLPTVQCYLCERVFQKRVEGAAHNRNYYRCDECLERDR